MGRLPVGGRPTAPSRRRLRREARPESTQIARSAQTPARPDPATEHRGVPSDVAAKLNYVNGSIDQARLHTGPAANDVARAHDANAITVGRDIYFAAGAYSPETSEGQGRLAHELTHVDQFMRGDLAGRGPGVVPPGDALEREASAAESGAPPAIAPQPIAQAASPIPADSSAAPTLRQPCVEEWHPLEILLAAASWDPDTEIELQNNPILPDMPALDAFLLVNGPSLVNVRFGTYAQGQIVLHYGEYGDHDCLYTDVISELWLAHPKLPDVPDQRMAIQILDDEVFGAIGKVGPSGVVTMDNKMSLCEWQDLYGPGLLALPDYRDVMLPATLINEVDPTGRLNFQATDYRYKLPGPGDSRHDGTASIELDNAGGDVLASATIRAPRWLGDASLALHRLPGGSFTGTARMTVGPFGDRRGGHAGFSGDLAVTYGRRMLDVMGTVKYDGERISGSGTLRLTDAVTAWATVRPHIIAAVDTMPPSLEPSTGMALVGWGSMQYRFGDWLRGSASAVVAPDGHIYSRGEIRPTGNIRFLDPPRHWPRRQIGPTFGPYSVELFDALFANVEAGGDVKLFGVSDFGPGQIHRLHLVGAFSTNTRVPWQLRIGGTINLAAMGQFEVVARLWIKGKLLRVLTAVDVTATISGLARLSADAEASAVIGRRLVPDDPEHTEYFIDGDFSAHAGLAVGLSGSVDFSALGIGVNLWTSANHEWPIGDARFEKHFAYTFGTPEKGNISIEAPGVGTSASALVHSLLGRSVPAHAAGRQADSVVGRWDPSGTEEVAPFADAERPHAAPAAEPALPNLDPVRIDPSITPPAPPAVTGGADAGVGGANSDSGQEGHDAGGPYVIAGTPLPPPPYFEFPDAPPRVAAEADDQTQVAEFTMEGVRHKLRLVPAHPLPRLIMESTPDLLETKLDNEIAEQTRDGDTDEVTALESIKTEAHALPAQADEAGFGEREDVPVPGLQPLADRIQTFADQFDEHDLNDGMPAAATQDFDPTSSAPEPDDVLEIPWADFQARVLALPPVDAITLLDRQHDYLQGEIQDLNRWLRANPTRDPTYWDVDRRRGEMTTRLGWVFEQRRRVRFEMNPNERVRLPCFSAGTMVHTPSGLRAIETLKIGDNVWSSDPITGAIVAGYVEGLAINRAIDFYDLHAGEDVITATGTHPFWDERTGAWIAARDVTPGVVLRDLGGGAVTVSAIERRAVAAAPTFNLVLGPFPTFFVGPGVLVHNGSYGMWHPYPWVSGSTNNFKIYVGLNDALEFRNYIYVGQTKQSPGAREQGHHDEANAKIAKGGLTPEDLFFFRFKQGMRLTVITEGLKGETFKRSNQARYLEQKNINDERNSGRGREFVINRIEACDDMTATENLIKGDPDVTRAGYCL